MKQLSIYEQADSLWNMPEKERNSHISTMPIWLRKAMIAFLETRKSRLRQAKEN